MLRIWESFRGWCSNLWSALTSAPSLGDVEPMYPRQFGVIVEIIPRRGGPSAELPAQTNPHGPVRILADGMPVYLRLKNRLLIRGQLAGPIEYVEAAEPAHPLLVQWCEEMDRQLDDCEVRHVP